METISKNNQAIAFPNEEIKTNFEEKFIKPNKNMLEIISERESEYSIIAGFNP